MFQWLMLCSVHLAKVCLQNLQNIPVCYTITMVYCHSRLVSHPSPVSFVWLGAWRHRPIWQCQMYEMTPVDRPSTHCDSFHRMLNPILRNQKYYYFTVTMTLYPYHSYSYCGERKHLWPPWRLPWRVASQMSVQRPPFTDMWQHSVLSRRRSCHHPWFVGDRPHSNRIGDTPHWETKDQQYFYKFRDDALIALITGKK